MSKEDVEPYGIEWEKEMMKWAKIDLIRWLKDKLIELVATKQELLELRKGNQPTKWIVAITDGLQFDDKTAADKHRASMDGAEFQTIQIIPEDK